MFNNTITKLLVGPDKPSVDTDTRRRRRIGHSGYTGNPSAILRENFNPKADFDKQFDNLTM